MTVRGIVQRALVAALMLTALGHVAAQQIGQPLPEFELRDQHGVLVTNADMLGGPWLLNVWASWCPPCRAELPLLERAAAELADDGLGLLLLNAGETAGVATSFLESEGLELRTLVDPDESERGLERSNDVLRRLRAGGLPTTYFVDADGTLLATFVGELTPDALAERLTSVYGFDWTP
ncbi:MAG: TlpA family protein disulfide reductase [Trueperaceae bacterium]|nr:MAG: TlpA family protein disulfide reductase [Trueperaceae bacterium]